MHREKENTERKKEERGKRKTAERVVTDTHFS
jgi:hypothetical protein